MKMQQQFLESEKIPGRFSGGLLPCTALLLGLIGFYTLIRKGFSASKNEAVQALFILLAVAFTILTATGVWFRGASMTLVWPWQM